MKNFVTSLRRHSATNLLRGTGRIVSVKCTRPRSVTDEQGVGEVVATREDLKLEAGLMRRKLGSGPLGHRTASAWCGMPTHWFRPHRGGSI